MLNRKKSVPVKSINQSRMDVDNEITAGAYPKITKIGRGNISAQILDSNFSNKKYGFTAKPMFNEKNFSVPFKLNSRLSEISLSDHVDDYSIIPQDSDAYLDGYKNYFIKVKEKMMKEHNISENSSEEETHIFVINFNSVDLGIEEMSVVDPSKDFRRYKLNLTDCADIKNDNIFYNGQIIMSQGIIKDGNEYFPTRIIFGHPLVEYKLLESSLNKYYAESLPYLISVAFGPFLYRNDLDITIFRRTLDEIAKDNPHTFIIGGPFLPIENSHISKGLIKFKVDSGEVSLNFFEFFQFMIEQIDKAFAVNIF